MQKSSHSSEYRALREELRRLRAAAGLSQRDLAAELGVAHSWVAKVESGERRIDLVEFLWFAAACEADPIASAKRIQIAANSHKGGRKK
jgi:transcriptional regulator with XRE-family HTH domain